MIKLGPRLSQTPNQSKRSSIVLKDHLVIFPIQGHQVSDRLLLDLAKIRLVFRVLLAERLLLGRCTDNRAASQRPRSSSVARSLLSFSLGQLVHVCLAGSVLFRTRVPRKLLCRVGVTIGSCWVPRIRLTAERAPSPPASGCLDEPGP